MPTRFNPQRSSFSDRSFSLIAIVIHIQAITRRPPHRGQPNHSGSISRPGKMTRPIVKSRIKQGDNCRRFEIATHNKVIAALTAATTSQSKIIWIIRTAQRSRLEVINRETRRTNSFRRVAIFASILPPFTNSSLRRVIDRHCWAISRELRYVKMRTLRVAKLASS